MPNMRIPFLVREQISALIKKRIEALDNGYRQNIGLVGHAGSGKTNFLTALFRSLSAQPKFISIYVHAGSIDFENLVDRWIGSLLTGLFLSQGITTLPQFHSLLLAADPIVPKTTEKIRAIKKAMRREKPSGLVRELFSLTDTLSQETGKKIIFMLDEFDRLEQFLPSDPFIPLGREIMMQKHTLYLVASSSPTKAREIFREKLSMLFGNFEVIDVGPLGFAETLQYLETQIPERTLSPAQKQFLVRMTDGIPVYLELIADRIQSCLAWNATEETSLMKDTGDRIPDASIIQSLYQELVSRKGRISHIFDKRLERCRMMAKDSSAYFRVLIAVSHGRQRLAAIASGANRRIPETKKILSRLLEEDLVSKRGSFYAIDDPLFRFWLKEVFEKRSQLYTPDQNFLEEEALLALRQEFQKAAAEEHVNFGIRIESLFKEFRNDVLEIDQKRIQCPQFSEITLRPLDAKGFTLTARNSKGRWHCVIAAEKIREEDVLQFQESLKKYHRKPQCKIFIMLRGIEQNAKLMSQEAGIHLWDLRMLNALLDLYDLPKIVLLPQKESHGQNLGALAQSVYTAG
jgi:hypothetical protein